MRCMCNYVTQQHTEMGSGKKKDLLAGWLVDIKLCCMYRQRLNLALALYKPLEGQLIKGGGGTNAKPDRGKPYLLA